MAGRGRFKSTPTERLRQEFVVFPLPNDLTARVQRHFHLFWEPTMSHYVTFVRHYYSNWTRVWQATLLGNDEKKYKVCKRWVNQNIQEIVELWMTQRQ